MSNILTNVSGSDSARITTETAHASHAQEKSRTRIVRIVSGMVTLNAICTISMARCLAALTKLTDSIAV